jgi:O-succinylbenzoic acid--CoA ligase
VPAGEAVLGLLDPLAEALAGGPPLMPYAVGTPVPAPSAVPLPSTALVVGTSGSTGRPKLAMLTPEALLASASATDGVLGGPGQWLLAMPAHHIAGLQVLVRSIAAGTTPVVQDLSNGFTAAGLVEATSRLTTARRYTALVPTQLARLVADPAAAEALASYDAVLVGGAATPPALLRQAEAVGVRALTTYGMSETAGGCVYAGRPLRCSRVRLADDDVVQLGGETLALGYLGDPELTARAFTTDPDGSRWFTTDDLGHQGSDGRWHVDGRGDDLINTGGLKVAPRVVEEAIAEHLPEAADVVVVGTSHPQWGQAVSAVIVLRDHGTAPTPTVSDVRSRLRGILPDHALPQRLLVVPAIPLRGPGKPDRAAVAALFA